MVVGLAARVVVLQSGRAVGLHPRVQQSGRKAGVRPLLPKVDCDFPGLDIGNPYFGPGTGVRFLLALDIHWPAPVEYFHSGAATSDSRWFAVREGNPVPAGRFVAARFVAGRVFAVLPGPSHKAGSKQLAEKRKSRRELRSEGTSEIRQQHRRPGRLRVAPVLLDLTRLEKLAPDPRLWPSHLLRQLPQYDSQTAYLIIRAALDSTCQRL